MIRAWHHAPAITPLAMKALVLVCNNHQTDVPWLSGITHVAASSQKSSLAQLLKVQGLGFAILSRNPLQGLPCTSKGAPPQEQHAH